MLEPEKKGPPSSHTRSRIAIPGPEKDHAGRAPRHRAARPNAPSASGRGTGSAKAAKGRSPARAGKIAKGVSVEASGDTPLSITEIVHENPHAAGESDISNNSGGTRTSRHAAKVLEATARMDRMEKAQGGMREAQDTFSAQQGMMSTQIEEIKKSVEGMSQLLGYVRQAQIRDLSGVPKEAVAPDPAVNGGRATTAHAPMRKRMWTARPTQRNWWMRRRTQLRHPTQTRWIQT